jgi:hypothetical protein
VHLLQDVFVQLQNPILQKKKKTRISEFQTEIKKNCFDLPNAFWKRKQHVIDLSYDNSCNEKQIPT